MAQQTGIRERDVAPPYAQCALPEQRLPRVARIEQRRERLRLVRLDERGQVAVRVQWCVRDQGGVVLVDGDEVGLRPGGTERKVDVLLVQHGGGGIDARLGPYGRGLVVAEDAVDAGVRADVLPRGLDLAAVDGARDECPGDADRGPQRQGQERQDRKG